MAAVRAIGSRVGGFEVEAMVGRGSVGTVFRARDQRDRTVALKIVASRVASSPGFRTRFIREAKLCSQVWHPNLLSVYDVGETEGVIYVATEFADGVDLATVIKQQGALEPARAARIAAQVGAALDAAHARGLLHRGLKPRAVLLVGDGSEVRLSDFGATSASADPNELQPPPVNFASPEQIRGEALDPRTDVYGLGGLFYTMLTGLLPFERDSDASALAAQLYEDAPDASRKSGVPAECAAVVRRAMAKSPDGRYESAGDFANAALVAAGIGDAAEARRLRTASDKERIVRAWQRSVAAGREWSPSAVEKGHVVASTAAAAPPPGAGEPAPPAPTVQRPVAEPPAPEPPAPEPVAPEPVAETVSHPQVEGQPEVQAEPAQEAEAEAEAVQPEAEAETVAPQAEPDAEPEAEADQETKVRTVPEDDARAEPEPKPAVVPAEPVADDEHLFARGGPARRAPRTSSGRRRPGLVVGVALLAAAAVVAVLLLSLGGDSGTPKQAGPATPQQPATPPAAPKQQTPPPAPPAAKPKPKPKAKPKPPPATAALAPWPAGRRGYTAVVYASSTDRATALQRARRASSLGYRSGVLRSDSFASLQPGTWVAYAGVFSSPSGAEQAVRRLRAAGLASAPYVRLIAP